MAIIDYHLVQNLQYANLSPSAKILIPVLSTLCDNITGAISVEDSKAENLGKYAGLGPKAVRSALQELARPDYKIVALETLRGRAPSIQYRPVVRIGKAAKRPEFVKSSTWVQETDPITSDHGAITSDHISDLRIPTSVIKTEVGHKDRPPTDEVGHKDRPHPDHTNPKTPPEPAQSQESARVATSLLLFKQPDLRTTTARTAAGKVPLESIRKARHIHGVVVDKILEAMNWFNGEIENPEAYFWTCCRTHIIPCSKEATARRKIHVQQVKRRERESRERQTQLDLHRLVEEENNDPDAQARIKAIQEQFLNKYYPNR